SPSYKMTLRDRLLFSEERARKVQAAAVRFLERHPDDPRRWEMVSWLSPTSPRFVLRWGDNDERGRPVALEVDREAAAAWRERALGLKEQMMNAPDVPADLKQRLVRQNLMRPFYDADPHYELAPVDLPALRRYLEAHLTAEPDSNLG